MIIVNSLAILYLYNQFTSLKKVGSKYLLGKHLYCTILYYHMCLGISTLFMIFASFIFGGGAIYIIDPSATGLKYIHVIVCTLHVLSLSLVKCCHFFCY